MLDAEIAVEEFDDNSEEVAFLLEVDCGEFSLLFSPEAVGAELGLFVWPVSLSTTGALPVRTTEGGESGRESTLAGGESEPVEVAEFLCSASSEVVLLPAVRLPLSEAISMLLEDSSAAQVRLWLIEASVSSSRSAEAFCGDVGAGTPDMELYTVRVS